MLHAKHLPVGLLRRTAACRRSPQDYLFQPGNYDDAPEQHGTPLTLREATFLQNRNTPAEVKVGGAASAAAPGLDAGERARAQSTTCWAQRRARLCLRP